MNVEFILNLVKNWLHQFPISKTLLSVSKLFDLIHLLHQTLKLTWHVNPIFWVWFTFQIQLPKWGDFWIPTLKSNLTAYLQLTHKNVYGEDIISEIVVRYGDISRLQKVEFSYISEMLSHKRKKFVWFKFLQLEIENRPRSSSRNH